MRSLLIVFTLIPLFSLSPDFNRQKLDQFFDNLTRHNLDMGSFCISKNGKVVYRKAFGHASFNPIHKADSLTKYRIGSISKTFTATVILQLVYQGKISLEDTLSKFFPEITNAGKITIEEILYHRSGLHDFAKDRSGKYRNAHPQTKAEVLTILRNAPSDFEPGIKTAYCNTNYVVLSLIAEEIEQKTFAGILQDKIVKPLDLKNTYYGGPINPENNEARSFYYSHGEWNRNTEAELITLAGAGAIVSTPSDLCVFMTALFNHKFFPQTYLDQMETMVEGVGMGLFSYPFKDKRIYGHAGDIDAFSSFAGYMPSVDVGFALCLNGERKSLNEVLVDALKIYFGY